MTNLPLDSNEIRPSRPKPIFSNLSWAEKTIRRLTLICMGFGILMIIREIFNYFSASEVDKSEILAVILTTIVITVSFSIPLVYIQHWQKLIRLWETSDNINLRKTLNTLRLGLTIGVLGSFIWLFYGVIMFLVAITNSEGLRFSKLLMMIGSLSLALNQVLQMWYYRKTFLIIRGWRKELRR